MTPLAVLEATAVVFGIAYLLLAVREQLACWYAAFISTCIYLYLFWEVRLLMESALQVYYLIMAVYGWYHWRSGGQGDATLPITTWSARRHLFAVLGVLTVSLASGWLLTVFSDARLPYLDSFTTWGSILTTWMVARKLLENWLYWLVIDSVSIGLYLDRQLYYTAALFLAYLLIALVGYRRWRSEYLAHIALQPAGM